MRPVSVTRGTVKQASALETAFSDAWAAETKQDPGTFERVCKAAGVDEKEGRKLWRSARVVNLVSAKRCQMIENFRVPWRECLEKAKAVLHEIQSKPDATDSARTQAGKALLDIGTKAGFIGMTSDDRGTETDSTEAVALRVVGGTDADGPRD